MFYSTTRRAVYRTTEGANVLTLSLSVLLMAPLPCELICVNQHSYVIFLFLYFRHLRYGFVLLRICCQYFGVMLCTGDYNVGSQIFLTFLKCLTERLFN